MPNDQRQISLLLLPECPVFYKFDVMNDVVATARHAGHHVRIRFFQKVGRSLVRRRFEIGSRAGMAIQAFAIVERLVKLDLAALRNCPQILHVDVGQAAPLVLQTAEHRVVGVAAVAGAVARDTVVLKM